MADSEHELERNQTYEGGRESLLQLSFTERDEYCAFPALIQAIVRYLDFERWGFRIIHAGEIISCSGIILQSEFCKVKIWSIRDRPYDEPEIYFAYGRLHAPNKDHLTTWNGETCHCWHSVRDVLNFLDDLSPQEISKNFRKPAFMHDFYESNKHRGWLPAEMQVRRESAMWQHYGYKLFSVFDLRHPDLWQQYSAFYKKLYDLRTRYPENDHSITPIFKIC